MTKSILDINRKTDISLGNVLDSSGSTLFKGVIAKLTESIKRHGVDKVKSGNDQSCLSQIKSINLEDIQGDFL